ncbi:MAG TPA: DUF1326 domain-containing protein [Gaiellaceae bacterium]
MTWALSGTYLESCNCEAICPCRKIAGVPGGRSTYGICMGVLSWFVEEGHADEIDLSRLAVAIVCRYDDDEPGSPWTISLHVDESAAPEAHAALTEIFLGREGGDVIGLPWNRKASILRSVRSSKIELDHVSERRFLRVAEHVLLRISRPVETDQTVTCVIPGHHQPGTEHYAEVLQVRDDPYEDEFTGNCAFSSRFAYSSDN